VLGTIFSSVGPTFYGRLLTGPDPYVPLMDWLKQANQSYPIWSVNVMDALWKNYETGVGVVNGISAMPSMHVERRCFSRCSASPAASAGCWLLTGFALAIFIGSIHLGWHYAIDGYVGALVAVFGWWAAGRIVAWDRRLCGAS